MVATAGSGGSISPSGTVVVTREESQTFTITAEDNYLIGSIVVDGAALTTLTNTYTFSGVITDHTIAVTFIPAYQPGIIGTYYHDRQWSLQPVYKTHSRILFANAVAKSNGYPGTASDVTDWPSEYLHQTNNFSVSFDGYLYADAAENYEFRVRGCNGYSLTVNGSSLISTLGSPSGGTAAFSVPTNTTSAAKSLVIGYHPFSAKVWVNSGASTPGEIAIFYRAPSTGNQWTIVTKLYHKPTGSPVAEFTGTPVSGIVPHTVKFTDASLNATTWAWDFGDHTAVSNLQNPSHTYTAAGQYNVTLTASNTNGSNTKTRSYYITVGSPASCVPGFAATYYPNYAWAEPGKTRTDTRIRFSDNYVSGGYNFTTDPTDEYKWPYGSGWMPSTEEFSVIWDGYLDIDTNDTYTFQLQSDDGSYLYVDDALLIDFGWLHDGSAVETASIPLSPGLHHITVKHYEKYERAIAYLMYHDSSTATFQYVSDVCHIEYAAVPVASFTATPTSGTAPLQVYFTDTSTNSPTSWSWNFGDGNTTGNTERNPVHLYTEPGSYPVTLTATNAEGSSTSFPPYISVASPPPTVTAVSPKSGPAAGGTTVTITGDYFTGATSVMFGTTAATTYTIDNDNQITATSPAHASGTVHITVTGPGGTSATSAADQFSFGAPSVTKVSPAAGPTGSRNTITITGTDFTGATSVLFDTTAAYSFTVNSATQITAVTQRTYTSDTVDVRVVTPLGTSPITPADEYTFGRPSVTGVSPNSGSTAGGTVVTVTGAGFTGVTGVAFGTTSAPTYTVDSDTQITVTSPARAAGTVDIRVTTSAGTSTATTADRFTYRAAPVVTSVSPAAGLAGSSVTITGTSFTGATAVRFGSTAATSFTVSSATSITAVAPAGSGTVDITVTTPVGTSATSAADRFSYGAPTVTSVSPTSGPTTGGTVVTITGTGFTGVTAVRFGATNALSRTVNSPTSITATSPARAAGTVDITVITPAGTSATSAADQFTYGSAPAISSSTPTSGPVGTSVTIYGTSFTGATGVRFGSVSATTYTVNSATRITVTAPPGIASGTRVNLYVTTPFGTSAATNSARFRYS